MAIDSYRGMTPKLGRDVYVHPSATVIGDVELGDEVSVWPGVVIRGDVNAIRIGAGSNIQDNAVLHVSHRSAAHPEGAPLVIGRRVSVGHGAILRRNVNALMPPPYSAEHDAYLARYRETHIRKIIGIGQEVLGRRKDGSVFPIDLSVSEVWLSDRRIFTGIVRDISKRKDAERALQESQERFALAVQGANDGI